MRLQAGKEGPDLVSFLLRGDQIHQIYFYCTLHLPVHFLIRR